MSLVLVVGRPGDLWGGHERGQAVFDVSAGEHLDVEVGERQHRAHAVLLAESFERGDVAGIVDQRDRRADLGGVLRGREGEGSATTVVVSREKQETMS